MCEWNTTKPVEVTIPADLSYTGETRRDIKLIDYCIAPLVSALDKAGIVMRSSCCGHGKGPGEIVLQDGRRLIIETGEER